MNTLPSSALMIYFKDYEQYHRTKGNKMTHLIGVPLVMFSLLGLLSYVVLWTPAPESLFRIDLGALLSLWGCVFAFKVDKKLAIPFTLYTIFNYLIARHLTIPVLVTLQVIAWIFQLWGHYVYEKKSPAFLTTLEHLFIGPLWIFSWVIGYYKPTTTA
ncbi:MAG: DUF962 domain-containing protein [Bdellovibrionales bacterium]|nr:DUF962 domain-containing protein [Bdellovibrionales bacterium]